MFAHKNKNALGTDSSYSHQTALENRRRIRLGCPHLVLHVLAQKEEGDCGCRTLIGDNRSIRAPPCRVKRAHASQSPLPLLSSHSNYSEAPATLPCRAKSFCNHVIHLWLDKECSPRLPTRSLHGLSNEKKTQRPSGRRRRPTLTAGAACPP